MKEYRLNTLKKTYSILISVGSIILAVVLIINNSGFNNEIYLVVGSILLFLFGIWTLKTTLDFKVSVDENNIQVSDNFKTKQLHFNEIEGYSSSSANIELTPKDKNLPILNIPSNTENYEELQHWVKTNFKDFDAAQNEIEKTEILQTEKFGTTQQAREQQLTRARTFAKVFNLIGAVIALWAFFLPLPVIAVWGFCLLFPITGLVLQRYYKGLIRFDTSKGSAYPSISAVFFVQFALLFRAFTDYDFLGYEHLILPTLLLAICLTIIEVYKRDEFSFTNNQGQKTLAVTFLAWMAYSYGLVVFYNCWDDHSHTKLYHAQIIEKHIYSGRSGTRYHIRLTFWTYGKENERYTITSSLYERLYVGETLYIHTQTGRLNAPWYYFSDDAE